MRALLSAVTSVVVMIFAIGGAAPVAATGPAIGSFSLSGSPFAQDFVPLPTSVTIKLVLAVPATVTVAINHLDGSPVRTIAQRSLAAGGHSWHWSGRDSVGAFVPDGQYVVSVRAVTAAASETQTRKVRKGLPAIYPANPGAIVVVVDPGHGGRYPGSSYNGVDEKTVNLATGLYLRDLLQRAGVTVVMTRTTDTAVDQPISDVNGDGLANSYDDIAARNDIANEARGDLNIHVHENAYGCRCARGTQTYTNFHRTWTPEASDLATDLQHEQLAALDQFSDGTYYPIDRGITNGNYDYMRPYTIACPTAQWNSCKPPFLPRPTLIPSVLMESLFLNNDIEFGLLQRSDVRLALAASYYLGIADWLNSRPFGAGYASVATPAASVAAGSPVSYRVHVTNRGNEPSSGWTLSLGYVPSVMLYDGSGAYGTLIGSTPIPDGLAPGDSVDVDVAGTAPGSAGDWLVKTDITLADGTHFADIGIASLQMPLTTTIGP